MFFDFVCVEILKKKLVLSFIWRQISVANQQKEVIYYQFKKNAFCFFLSHFCMLKDLSNFTTLRLHDKDICRQDKIVSYKIGNERLKRNHCGDQTNFRILPRLLTIPHILAILKHMFAVFI